MSIPRSHRFSGTAPELRLRAGNLLGNRASGTREKVAVPFHEAGRWGGPGGRRITPDARIAYVDNDPVVLAHARALMVSDPRGNVGYLDADIRTPEAIVGSDLVRKVLDFDEPIALILSAILHFVPDEERPAEIVRTFVEALPPGGYVLASHVTPEHEPRLRPASAGYRDDGVRTRPRTAAEFERLVFAGRGLELVPPGVVLVSRWRRDPDEPPAPSPAEVSAYGGLAKLAG